MLETRCLLWLSGTVLWWRNQNLACEKSHTEVWGERPPTMRLGTLTQTSRQQDVSCKLHTQKKTEKNYFHDCQTCFWTTGSTLLTIEKGIKTVGIPRWNIKIVSSTFWVWISPLTSSPLPNLQDTGLTRFYLLIPDPNFSLHRSIRFPMPLCDFS